MVELCETYQNGAGSEENPITSCLLTEKNGEQLLFISTVYFKHRDFEPYDVKIWKIFKTKSRLIDYCTYMCEQFETFRSTQHPRIEWIVPDFDGDCVNL